MAVSKRTRFEVLRRDKHLDDIHAAAFAIVEADAADDEG